MGMCHFEFSLRSHLGFCKKKWTFHSLHQTETHFQRHLFDVLGHIIFSHRLNLQIECKRVTSLNPLSVEWAFELTRANMQTL